MTLRHLVLGITCRKIAQGIGFAVHSPVGERMRLTRHNGRAGKHGTYNPKHNDRSFDLENSEHINAELAKKNVYWDCYNGFRSLAKEELLADTFEEVEEMFYSSQYRNHVESQNQRNEKNRHPERNRTTSDLLKNKKTAPEETIFQIGTIDNHVPPEILLQVVTDFLVELDTRFGKNVHILDWALHLDEGTPHIHERHVFDCENSYGEVAPQQEKALEELGFELPDPTQKPSKINNRKKTFDSVCRVILFNITKKYGLDLEEEPEYGGRAYLEKQDYILMKQKQQMEQQEKKLEELTVKIEDIETLVDEVADVAYDKAVEVVSDTVRMETHKEDIRLIEETQNWLRSPERKAPKKEREYAIDRLDGVVKKIRNSMQNALNKLQTVLMKPSVKNAGKEKIKEKAKESIYSKLARAKISADTDNQARWEQQKHQTNRKKDMEL